MDRPIDEHIDRQIDKCMYYAKMAAYKIKHRARQMDLLRNIGLYDGHDNRQIDEQVDRQIDGQIDRWIDR